MAGAGRRVDGSGVVRGRGASGRGFVIVLALLLGGVSLALYLGFRQWKAEHVEWAAYGAERVATVVSPVAQRVPAGVTPEEWGKVVDAAKRVVVGLTASGALDIRQMRVLRGELQERFNGVRPEGAAEALLGAWEELERRAGPVLTRSPKYGAAASAGRLAGLRPDGVAPERWALAVVQTRGMLVEVAGDDRLGKDGRRRLSERVEGVVAGATEADAAEAMGRIWAEVKADPGLPAGYGASVLERAEPKSPEGPPSAG
jgi:hypothetical protein